VDRGRRPAQSPCRSERRTMETQKIIDQAAEWLSESNDKVSIELLLDLPEVNWVEVKAISQDGDIVSLTYRGLGMSGVLYGDVEMQFDLAAARAVRRRNDPNIDVDAIFGRTGNEKGARS